jgi:hypothetical protein
MLSEKKIHRIGRIDQVVRDYFEAHPSQKEIAAKDLMPIFITKGIFVKDHRDGLPIMNLLRELDREKKLYLLKYAKLDRKNIYRNWYFAKPSILF